MWKAGFKSVLAHKVRLALTAMAIVLGVSLVAGTFIFTDTIDRQFDGLFDDIFSGLDVSVRKASGDFGANAEPFDASVLDTVSGVAGVAVVEGGVDTFASQVLDRDGEPIGGQGPPTLGFSWGVEPSLNPLKISAENGRPPTGPGEVVIDINTANVGEFEVGDTVTIVNFAGPEQFELVGIASFGDSDTLLGATLTAFELDEARRLFGFGDEFTGLSMTAVDGVSSDELAESVQAVLPADLEAVTGQTQQNEQADEIDSALGFLNIGLLAFAGVAVFVGGFIIQNTFRIIVAQRTRELALMRAIGATGSQVTRLVLIEAFITAVVASIVGIGFGMVMALGIRGLMNAVGFGLPPGSLVLAPRTIIVGLIVGVGLTVISGLFPARKAAKVPPVAAMREEAATMPRRSLRRRAIIGSSISALGAALLLFGLFGGIDNAIALVGAGAAVLFIGISVLAPLAAKPLADIIGAPLPRMFGVSGTLAKENTKRKPRRTASTASALMIGVALVAFFSIFGASTKASIEDTISELFPADLTVQSVNPSPDGTPLAFSPAFTDRMRALDEIETISAMQFGAILVDGEQQFVGAFEPETIDEVFKLEPVGDALNAAGTVNTLLVSTEKAEADGLSVGDTVTVEYSKTGEVETTIAGLFAANDFTDFYMSRATYGENFTAAGDGLIFARVADGVDIADAQAKATAIADEFGNIKVQTNDEIVVEAEQQIDQALALFTGLLLFAVIIAVLGITNTLALSIYERTREIGLLRAVGMSRRQVRQMVRWEAVIIALFGALLGVGIGIFLGWAVVRALADEGFGSFAIPWGQVVLALVLAGVAGVIAAIWPARRASRLNVLEAISYE